MAEKVDKYDDPMYESMYRKPSMKDDLKIYGVAFAVVVFGIMPWAIGACMMIKWGFQLVF